MNLSIYQYIFEWNITYDNRRRLGQAGKWTDHDLIHIIASIVVVSNIDVVDVIIVVIVVVIIVVIVAVGIVH